MAKWYKNIKKVKYSKNDRRFLSSFDMAEEKRARSIYNSEVNRGERKDNTHQHSVVCRCGASGCIFRSGWDSEDYNK